jgi:hypothetical protein
LSSKIGRNEPCPCGSGKKYKHCCLSNASVMTSTPMLNKNPYDDDFYQPMDITEDKESFLIQKITDLMWDIMPEVMLDEPMSGIDASKYFQELTSWVSDPKDDTCLDFTPMQVMSSFLSTLDNLPELFDLNDTFTGEDVAEVPLMQYIAYLLFLHTQESGGVLELTAKGNYRPSTVLKFNSHIYKQYEHLRSISLEDHSYDLQLVHQIIIDLGLVEETSRKSYLTTEGLQAALPEDLSHLYSKVVQLYFDDFDWIEYSFLETLDIFILDDIQETALFSLNLLNKNASQYISIEDLYGKFVRAFPDFDKITKESLHKPSPVQFYHYIFIRRFCMLLGLVEEEDADEAGVDAVLVNRDYSMPRIKITPLFRKLFSWKV